MRARCSQPLSTNQTPHPTTKMERQPPQSLSPVSHTRDEEIAGLLSQSPIVCLMIPSPAPIADSRTGINVCRVHQTRTHYRRRPIQRIAQVTEPPHDVGGP